eukprot:4505071-Prymnesium_polylepis.1
MLVLLLLLPGRARVSRVRSRATRGLVVLAEGLRQARRATGARWLPWRCGCTVQHEGGASRRCSSEKICS